MAIKIAEKKDTEIKVDNGTKGAKPSFVNTGKGGIDREDDLVTMVVKGLSSVKSTDRNGRLHARNSGLCEKQAVISAVQTGVAVETASSKAYYRLGVEIEDLVLTSLYEEKALLFKNYRLPDIGINLGGYIDGIIHLNGRIRILEIKSCGELPDMPKDEHAAQALMYSAVTGLPATVFYFSRQVAKYNGTMLLRQFDLEDDDSIKRSTLWRAVYAHLAIQRKVVPYKPMHMKNVSMCGFCPFVPNCWEGQELDEPDWSEVDANTHLEITRKAQEITSKLMDPKVVAERRAGVMKYLSTSGNPHAKSLLSGTDWSHLIGL